MLIAILVLGFAAATCATIVRALVPTLWLLHQPFSCDLCMSWWSCVVVGVLVSARFNLGMGDMVLAIPAGTAVAMTILKIHNRLSDIKLE